MFSLSFHSFLPLHFNRPAFSILAVFLKHSVSAIKLLRRRGNRGAEAVVAPPTKLLESN